VTDLIKPLRLEDLERSRAEGHDVAGIQKMFTKPA